MKRLLILSMFAVATGSAFAASGNIGDLLVNTGVDATDGKDNLYLMAYATLGDPANFGTEINPFVVTPNAAWLANTADSSWIGPQQNAATQGADAGMFRYRYEVNLDGFASGLATGSWTSDNDATLWVNGVKTVYTVPFDGFRTWHAFEVGLQPGVNTIDFIVHNPVWNTTNPSGVRVQWREGTGVPAVPEPFTLALMAGAGALAMARRRRR